MKKVTKDEKIEDLYELSNSLGLDSCSLDGDLYDACQVEAMNKYESMRDKVLLDKLTFLHEQGFSIKRLRELITEYANSGGNSDCRTKDFH